MKVEFLVDITSRDLPIACRLAGALREVGDETAITSTFVADGEKRSTFLRSLREKADILLTPWYNSPRTLEILARARFAGAHLVHFPSEQFFSASFDREKLNVAASQAYRRQVVAVFVWGQYYARRLVEQVGYPRERIYEVGSPRLEFARHEQDSETARASDRPLRVLFISDFNLADLDTPGRRKRFANAYGVKITPGVVGHVASEREYMLDTADRVSRLGGYEIRVRPHPGEKQMSYHAACEGTSMKCCDPAVPFSNDVSWADVVVGYTSTSIFEVAVAGRPFLSLRRREPPEVAYREGLEELYDVCTSEQLIARLSDRRALEAAGRQLAAQAEFYVGNVNGAFQPVTALRSALHRRFESNGTLIDSAYATVGAFRSMSKYLAFRLFASGVWSALGGWKPAPVKRRLSPGHALTDEGIFNARETWEKRARGNSAGRVSWEMGRWCWRPVVTDADK